MWKYCHEVKTGRQVCDIDRESVGLLENVVESKVGTAEVGKNHAPSEVVGSIGEPDVMRLTGR